MHPLKFTASLCLSISILALAASLWNVSVEMNKTREALPAILTQIETTEDKLDIQSWLKLSQNLSEQIPVITNEVAQTRDTLNAINSNIPPLLKQVSSTQTNTLPAVLAETQAIRSQSIPSILSEIAAVREMTPATLARIQKLIADAQSAAGQASKDAVEGGLEGVVDAPADIVEQAGDEAASTIKKDL